MVVYNGQNFLNFGVYSDTAEVFAKPEADYQTVSVAGRNGDIRISNGRYANLEITIPCFIREHFIERFTAFSNFLLQDGEYHRLENTAQPSRYRMAAVKTLPPKTGAWLKSGLFTITFDAKPQVFLVEGERAITFTKSGTIFNSTLQDAKPLLRVYGSGTLGIGNINIIINTTYPYIDIDCDVMDAVYDGNNANAMITLSEFPVLKSGLNNIALGTGITRVEVTPRWWEL